MTTTTTSISDFLRAMLDADEAAARAALDAPDSEWWVSSREQRVVRGSPSTRVPIAEAVRWQTAAHIARHDPARVLAQVAAIRAVVEMHAEAVRAADEETDTEEGRVKDGVVQALHDTLRALAQAWASHPAFDPAWSA